MQNRTPLLRVVALWLWIVTSIVAGTPAIAQVDTPVALPEIRNALNQIERELENEEIETRAAMDDALSRVSTERSKLVQCVTNREQELSALRSSLGTEYIKEIQEKSERSTEEGRLTDQIARLSRRISECKLLLERANSQQSELVDQQLALQREDLTQRDGNVFTNIRDGSTGLLALVTKRLRGVTSLSVAERDGVRLSSILMITITGFLAGLLINRRSTRSSPARPTAIRQDAVTFRILFASWFIIRKWSPILLPVCAVSLYLAFTEGDQFLQYPVNRLTLLVIGYVLLVIFFRATVRWYREYASRELSFKVSASALFTRLVIAATSSLLWLIFLEIPNLEQSGDPAWRLLHNLLTSAVVLSHLELALSLPRFVPMNRLATLIRLSAITLLGIALAFEYLGYLNLSTFVWGGVLASAAAVFLFLFIGKLFNDFYNSVDAGTYRWQQRFRSILSVQPDEPLPGLVWIRLLTISMLWIGLGLLLLKAWGFSDARIASVFSFLRDGIRIGDSQIVLGDVLVGILLFALLLMLIRWGKDSLDKKYLARSRMDVGAREAIVTISGYVGFVIAALIGLTVAGVKFSNLAIIAGALSLGIGFGLQNIVNNFVSGIILLFERPIRTGDWIITGNTEGYVRKISVRSTEVQTFDRSDVIVPNSELISAEVTNWTLRDKFGRVIVKVGVAYGSDTALVEEVLMKIPEQFPEIVHDRPMLPTKVFFREFGDSTLNFELRCFIYDIAGILDITSNLHFAIDKAFREHGIEIAFPQRDIHIRSEPTASS